MAGAALLFAGSPGCSLPLLGSAQDADGLRVYADSASPRVFYYAPGQLSIASDKDNRPEISFLQMRYMGTSAAGDKGEFRTRSILSFGVKMAGVTSQQLSSARARLRSQRVLNPLLKPLPIRKVEAVLNYTPLADTGSSETPAPKEPDLQTIGQGALESAPESKPGGGYWSERMFTIAPDDATSQALWDAFQSGRVMMSLSYSFFADGIPPEQEKPKVEGNIEIPEETESKESEDRQPDPQVVLADTVAVTVDAKQFPERFKQIDLNEGLPANYAALSIYCYDFNNELRPDLFEKVVEIQAASVTGKPVTGRAAFSRSSPDVYAATVRFPFAISFKSPYKFRLREITLAGEEKVKPWLEGRPWAQMLDVTTPPEEQPKRPQDSDSGEDEP